MIEKPAPSPQPVPAPKAVRRNPAVNVLWNWAGVGVEAVTGFLIAPLLINGLGDESYGLWILIGSMTGCFGMLDLGMRGAVGRFVAFHHAKNDQKAVEQVLSTAAVALSAVALLSVGLTVIFAWALPWLYAIPADQIGSVRWAAIIVGIQLALFFVLRMFDATLWAYQRFDLLNLIDIPTTILRAALIAWLVASGRIGLISLAWVSLAAVLASGLAKCWCTYRHSPGLRIRPRLALRSTLVELVGYGFWNFLISVAALARTQLSPLLVGGLVGLPAVGPFSIVMRLPTMATMILTAATGVFTPVAVAIHAHEDHARRQRLLIEGTRLSLCLALYFLALFIWLGKPLLTLWIRPDFAAHWPLLVIIGCGEVLPMTMSVATGMLQAMAQHRAVAWMVALEALTSLAAAALFSYLGGLIGFVAALSCAATFFRGLLILTHVCRHTGLSPISFVRQTLVVPAGCIALAVIPLHLLVMTHSPSDWSQLIATTLLFSFIYLVVIVLVVIGRERTLRTFRRLRSSQVVTQLSDELDATT